MDKIRKIVFMGTPDFAVGSLKALVNEKYDVTVITQQDKPRGRGHEMKPTPVKEYALLEGLDVYEPSTLKSEEFFALLKNLNPDIIVVAAYGKILPQNVLDFPKFGCINVHGSLLPKYRGAAPIQRAIINGETETGITIMQMEAGLDTGDMLLKESMPITEKDNFETVFDGLVKLGASALVKALKLIESGEIIPQKQDDSLSCYAEKIEKSDCLIDFSKPARTVFNQIRGLSPIPLAYTFLNGSILKVAASEIVSENKKESAAPGTVIFAGDSINVVCNPGVIAITEVLPAGKRRMASADFVRGKKIHEGDMLCSAEKESDK